MRTLLRAIDSLANSMSCGNAWACRFTFGAQPLPPIAKGTDLSVYSQAKLSAVARRLNEQKTKLRY
jgi:hypothetical protein